MAAKPYDPTLKALVETDPASWPALLGQPTRPTEVIDADIATVSGAADKVLRVSAEPPYLLHLEFVSGHDAVALPPKLLVRNGLLSDRHELPVRTGVVVLHPGADSPRLSGVYKRGFPGEEAYLTFRYRVVRVWQLPPGPLLSGGLGLLPLAPISAVTEAELPGIIERMEQRLRGRGKRKQAAAAYILLGLRHSGELAAQLFRGVVSMRESTTYQAILNEGRQAALTEVARGLRETIRRVGDAAFGPPDAQTAAALDRIADFARLEALVERLRTAGNWQELLGPQTPNGGRRRGRRSP